MASMAWVAPYTDVDDSRVRSRDIIFLERLHESLGTFTTIKFDHIKVGVIGKWCCVFVAKGNQSIVLHDRTKDFPSANLLAALTLLGSD